MNTNKIIGMNEYLKEIFKKINFNNTSILDAGTGRGSAQMLVDSNPKELSCVAYLGDLRKGEKVHEILERTNNEHYKLIYGDLANKDLFKKESFDYVLGHLLIGELKVGKVESVISNLFYWLKPNGKIFLTDREFCEGFEVKSKYVSMGKIVGNPELSKRSNRDLYELLNLFLNIPEEISLLTQRERSFDYPSSWVQCWLEKSGFKKIKCLHFKSKEKLKEGFLERIDWIKQRIENLENINLKKGLLNELEKIIIEFENRKIDDDSIFLRENFFFQAEKL
jgi:hypothetical protein